MERMVLTTHTSFVCMKPGVWCRVLFRVGVDPFWRSKPCPNRTPPTDVLFCPASAEPMVRLSGSQHLTYLEGAFGDIARQA
jgi:hypothetical protein